MSGYSMQAERHRELAEDALNEIRRSDTSSTEQTYTRFALVHAVLAIGYELAELNDNQLRIAGRIGGP